MKIANNITITEPYPSFAPSGNRLGLSTINLISRMLAKENIIAINNIIIVAVNLLLRFSNSLLVEDLNSA